MLNHVLGNNRVVLGLNELHFVGNRWSTSTAVAWSRDQAVEEAAGLMAVARRSIWNKAPTAEELAEAESLLPSDGQPSYAPAEVYAAVLSHLAAGQRKKYVVDQTPRNIAHGQFLLRQFPEARIVQLVRDPRAVLWSQRNRWRQRWIGAPHTPLRNAARVFLNYHPFTASKLWLAAFRQGKNIEKDPRYLRLRFEDIVSNPEASVRDLCAFLGIAYDPEMLDVANVGSSHIRHDEQKRGVSTASLNAWEGNLPVADLWICERLAGNAMDELGYERKQRRVPIHHLLASIIRFPFHAVGVVLLNPLIALRTIRFTFRAR